MIVIFTMPTKVRPAQPDSTPHQSSVVCLRIVLLCSVLASQPHHGQQHKTPRLVKALFIDICCCLSCLLVGWLAGWLFNCLLLLWVVQPATTNSWGRSSHTIWVRTLTHKWITTRSVGVIDAFVIQLIMGVKLIISSLESDLLPSVRISNIA